MLGGKNFFALIIGYPACEAGARSGPASGNLGPPRKTIAFPQNLLFEGIQARMFLRRGRSISDHRLPWKAVSDSFKRRKESQMALLQLLIFVLRSGN
eukprot:692299-Hanusia_phi.AAC.1